jgi:Flp pilus assembly protein TadD
LENTNDCYAYSSSGLAYANSGNVTDAVIAGKTAYQLAGNDDLTKSDMTINLAKIYLLTGDYANATREVEFLLNNPSGFSMNLLKVDPDWKKLAETPEFKKMTGKGAGTRQ